MPATNSPSSNPSKTRSSAVALKAAPGRDVSAPARIIAKGDGALADQILELAFANGVKVREDADLVEVLNAVDVDCDVPLHALAAVAEILTYVYRANGDLATAASPHNPDSEQEG
ncbi:MAG: EscU/YscU/HrcU family type III secretion system export apparatus switch protein [Alphaproteobacteria bacterium]